MRLTLDRSIGGMGSSISQGNTFPLNNDSDSEKSSVYKSLDDIYRAHAPRLLRRFSRRNGRQDAEDLLQETFVRFTRIKLSSVKHIESPGAYLSIVASHLLQERAKRAFLRSFSEQFAAEDMLIDMWDPHDMLEARDALNRLNDAIKQLNPTTQQVFLAHRLDGMSHLEIAELTGLSMAAVARRMTKAIAHVHRVMRKY